MDEKLKELEDEIIKNGKENKLTFCVNGRFIGTIDVDTVINEQPLDGLLYDLNLLPEVALLEIETKPMQAMKDYARYLVIKRLYERMKGNETMPSQGKPEQD